MTRSTASTGVPNDGSGTGGAQGSASLACVILAHTDPVHVKRLIAALDPFPVFLHCDAGTPDEVFAAMTTDLPDRVVVLDRLATGWAKWENVAAELAGYRAALQTTDATHVALLTGTDYPLAATEDIAAVLDEHRGTSFARIETLPHPGWSRGGGFDRLRYRHWVFRKHMLRLPIPRKIPQNIVPAGGSQLKILARQHAQAVVDVADQHPELVRFWRRSWVADETFVPSVLSTPHFVPGWQDEHVAATPWWIGWDGSRRKSPPWLGMEHLKDLKTRRNHVVEEIPKLFARKFSTADSSDLLDAIDATLRIPSVVQT
jgi:hypothetical protein